MWLTLFCESAACHSCLTNITLTHWSPIMSEQHRAGCLCYVTSICVPFGWSQLRTRHTAVYCFAWVFVVCVFKRAKGGSIFAFILWKQSNQSNLNKLPSNSEASQFPAADDKAGAHPASLQLLIQTNFFETLTLRKEPDVHYAHSDTYRSAEASAWRCVLCNSRVEWSQNTHQTLATTKAASSKRLRARWGGVGGLVTLVMSSDLNMCCRRSAGFQHISWSRGRVCTQLFNEESDSNNDTITSWEEMNMYVQNPKPLLITSWIWMTSMIIVSEIFTQILTNWLLLALCY